MASPQRWHEVLAELHALVGAPGSRAVEEHARRDRDAVSLSKSTVSSLIKGEGNPRRSTVEAFVLGCLAYARAHRRTGALPDGGDQPVFWMRRYDRCALREVRADRVVKAAVGPGAVSVTVPWGRLGEEVAGREELVERLVERVRASTVRPQVLVAGGGYGKTTVALQVAQAVDGEVRVWWVDASTAQGLTAGLAEVALRAGADRAAVRDAWSGVGSAPDLLWDTLHAMQDRWLLVLDNADAPQMLALPGESVRSHNGWLRAGRTGIVLVTSRDRDRATWGPDTELHPVSALDDQTGAQVLLALAPEAGDAAAAEALSRRLGGLPLALRLAGSYLATADTVHAVPGFTPVRRFVDYGPSIDLRHSETVSTTLLEREQLSQTWELSLDMLASRGMAAARPLLRLLACLPAVPVPLFVLDASVLGTSPLLQGIDPPALAALTAALVNVGLLERITVDLGLGLGSDPRRVERVAAVWLHPVIREVSRVVGDQYAAATLCLEMLALAVEKHPIDREETNYLPWRLLLPHCARPQEWLFSGVDEDADMTIAYLQFHAAVFVNSQEEYVWALDLYEEVIERQTRAYGEEAIPTLMVRHNRACTLWRKLTLEGPDALRGAEVAFVELVAVQERVLGPDHSLTRLSRHNLGCVRDDIAFLGGH